MIYFFPVPALHRSCLPCNSLEIWHRVHYRGLFVGRRLLCSNSKLRTRLVCSNSKLAWRARKKATVSGKAKSGVQKSRLCSPPRHFVSLLMRIDDHKQMAPAVIASNVTIF